MEDSIITFTKHRLIFVGLVGLGGFALAGHATIVRQMDEWKLLPRRQGFTELYFTHPRQPVEPRADLIRHVDFTIRNSQDQLTMYRYTLSVTPADGHAKTAGQGVVEVRHGKSRRIQQDIVLPDATGRVNLQITIDYQGIHFGSDTPSMQRQTISHWIRLPELQHDKVTL